MALLLWKTWRKSLDDSQRPDAILVWGAWPLAPLLLGSLGDIPSTIALRGSDVPGFNPRTTGFFWKHLAASIWNRASVVTANSPTLARLAKHTAHQTPIVVIPNGVAMPRGLMPRRFPDECLEGRRPFRILAVSRLIPRKRIEWLVEAVSLLPPDFRRIVEVTIAGDGPERFRLETMVQELDMASRFHFLGIVPDERMPQLYREADLFVHTSQAEGLSNALLEAMAHGLPCVCSEPTGFADLDCELMPAASIHDLAKSMIAIIENTDDDYGDFSRACQDVASHYQWKSVAGQYVELLEGLLKQT